MLSKTPECAAKLKKNQNKWSLVMMTTTQHLKFLISSNALKTKCTSIFSSNFLFKEDKCKSSGVLKM